MRLLVFGKTGQVARELARRVPEARYLGRDQADLEDPEACAAVLAGSDADLVINAAAYTAVDRAEEEEDRATAINGAAPGAMARAAAAKGIPFLHVSTDYVLDGSGEAPRGPGSATGPLGAYGRSKLAGERAVAGAGGQWLVLRTSWVVSAHGSNFVKTMLRLGAERDELTIIDDQIGGPTPAAAIAEALLAAGRRMLDDPQAGGLHHFSGAPDVSWAGFAAEIFAQAGLDCRVIPIPTTDYPTPAARPLNSRLDCSSLEADFGIERPDWRAGLAEILKELKLAA